MLYRRNDSPEVDVYKQIYRPYPKAVNTISKPSSIYLGSLTNQFCLFKRFNVCSVGTSAINKHGPSNN